METDEPPNQSGPKHSTDTLMPEPVEHSSEVRNLALHSGGRRLVSAGGGRAARIWDVATGERISTFRDHQDGVVNVSWSPDGRMLLSLGVDGQVRVWDATRGYDKEEDRD